MNITATLTNDTGTINLPDIEVPLSVELVDSAVDVVTLSNDIYTDFTNQKRGWKFIYDSLPEDTYNALKAYYDEQFSAYYYPTLSIPHYSVSNVTVRMYINTREVYNDCGSVENVEITFRETAQLPEGS